MIGARNIAYHGALFDLEATTTTMRITCTRNPSATTFYMTGPFERSGTFTIDVPLVQGAMVLSTKPQGSWPFNATRHAWLFR